MNVWGSPSVARVWTHGASMERRFFGAVWGRPDVWSPRAGTYVPMLDANYRSLPMRAAPVWQPGYIIPTIEQQILREWPAQWPNWRGR